MPIKYLPDERRRLINFKGEREREMERSESEGFGHARSPLTRYVPPRARSHHQGDEATNVHWVPMSPNYGSFNDHEENHDHHNVKRSVLMKVKEKARKWKHLLAKKKHGHEEENSVPPWGVSLDEGEEEDPEYHGAPMYESEHAPEIYKHASPYQAPAFQFISRMHETPDNVSRVNTAAKESEMKQGNDMNMKQHGAKVTSPTSNCDYGMMKNNAMFQKLLVTDTTNNGGNGEPADIPQLNTSAKKESEMKQINDMHVKLQEAKVSISPTNSTDHGIKNKVMHQNAFADIINASNGKSDISQMNCPSDKESEMKQANGMHINPQETKVISPSKDKDMHQLILDEGENGGNKKLTEKVAEVIAPAYIMVSEATNMIAMKMQESKPELAKQVWNKVVPMKGYLMNKLEPGEDDRALCQVITEAVSPKTASPKTSSPSHTDQPGVLSKYKEAISNYLRKEESMGSPIPVSTNPHPEVVDASGRKLQSYSN